MNEVVTSNESARALVTEIKSKDAQTEGKADKVQPAVNGQGGGKSLPPASASPIQSQRAAGNAERLQEVSKAVAEIEQYVQSVQRDLRFHVDEELGRAIVHVIDRSTQKIIRQIPSEEVVQMARNLNAQKEQAEHHAQISSETAGARASQVLRLVDTRI